MQRPSANRFNRDGEAGMPHTQFMRAGELHRGREPDPAGVNQKEEVLWPSCMRVPPISTGMSTTTPVSRFGPGRVKAAVQKARASDVAADVVLMVALPRTASPS